MNILPHLYEVERWQVSPSRLPTARGHRKMSSICKVISVNIENDKYVKVNVDSLSFFSSTKVDKINSRQGIRCCASIINQGRNSINYFAEIIKFFLKFREVNK